MILENPVTSTLAFNYASAGNEVNKLSIYTSSGNKVYTRKIRTDKGSNIFQIPLECMTSKGIYFVEIVNSRERVIARLVK